MKTHHHITHRTLLSALVIVSALVLFLGAPAQAAPPDNDDFDNATVIAALPTTIVQDTTEATTAGDDPVCSGDAATVWFAYTPAAEQLLAAHTFGSNFDTTLAVYTGERGSLTQIACNDDTSSLQSAVSFTAQAGVTYFFRAAAYGSNRAGGELHFSLDEAAPPPNDDFDNATPITAAPYRATQNIGLATPAADDPDCFWPLPSVWFAFTPAEDITVSADTFGSSFDTTLCVYTGERGALTPVAANDNAAYDEQSYLIFAAQGGERYTIQVGNWDSHSVAQLSLRLREINPIPAHDDFDHAAVADTLPYVSPVDGGSLTAADDDPWNCRMTEQGTAWFAFTPEEDITVEAFALGGNFPWETFGPQRVEGPDAVEALPGIIGVYTGERGALTPIGCQIERLRLDAVAGETYYFMVSNIDQAFYAKVLFILKEALPEAPNDDFDDATPIPALIFTDQKYTGRATQGADDPSLPGCGSSVWYRYTPEASHWLSADTAGSDYDTLLALYTGQRGALTRLAANDDHGESLQSTLTYYVEGGETYYLMVCAHVGEIPFNLHLRVAPILYSYLPLLNRVVLNSD